MFLSQYSKDYQKVFYDISTQVLDADTIEYLRESNNICICIDTMIKKITAFLYGNSKEFPCMYDIFNTLLSVHPGDVFIPIIDALHTCDMYSFESKIWAMKITDISPKRAFMVSTDGRATGIAEAIVPMGIASNPFIAFAMWMDDNVDVLGLGFMISPEGRLVLHSRRPFVGGLYAEATYAVELLDMYAPFQKKETLMVLEDITNGEGVSMSRGLYPATVHGWKARVPEAGVMVDFSGTVTTNEGEKDTSDVVRIA